MIADDLGRIFEVGFNIGILSFIQTNKIDNYFGDRYRQDLQNLNFDKLLKSMLTDASLIGQLDSQIIEKWSLLFLQKGFLSGLNFFREYIQATGWKPERIKILYYQCSFAYQNSLRTYPKLEQEVWQEALLQLSDWQTDFSKADIDSCIHRYSKKGEFLQADTLLLLQNNQQFRILCVDLSVFSLASGSEILNLGEIEVLRDLSIRDISYLRSKSSFSNLRIDTSTLGVDFAEELKRYFTAFKYKDKESSKLIQAGSYANSFYQFLLERGAISDRTEILFNIVGYSDRSLNTLSLTQDQKEILATCAKIYKQEIKGKDIAEVRKEVLTTIRLNAASCFQDGRKFVNRILDISNISGNSITSIVHTEKIENFCNSVDPIPEELATQLEVTPGLTFRESHAELIVKFLNSSATYLFLTGNPGIGKTTAIATFLKHHLDDGFLLFYASPRKQVNLDIIEKFKDPATGFLCDDRLFCINTNADLIKSNRGRHTVQYVANSIQQDFTKKLVHFQCVATQPKRQEFYQKRLKRKGETTLKPVDFKIKGVLDSISEAIYTLISEQTYNQIIATVSIQSLKIAKSQQSTFQHFKKIFKDAWNEKENQVIPAKMQAISRRIKHLFIVIDEITGDSSGVAFLEDISKIIKSHQLTKHGFNTKAIVADASIVDPDVIQQHLNDSAPEPDKIYFKKLATHSIVPPPLQVIPFNFKRLPAVVINTNSYPASSLQITYKILVEFFKVNQPQILVEKNSLVQQLQSEIVQDIKDLLAQAKVEQLIVYIQDKRRLAELIEKLKKEQGFEQYRDYLEIHANISETEKEQIQRCKDRVRVIFMTASGSRGLSFPKTKHILIDIPRFQIEQNLMELIQVIYRGRGEYEPGKTFDTEGKALIFYLSDRVLENEGDSDRALLESKLFLLNFLLILKTSIMTRIVGYGQLGRERFLMIPIGGKSVSATGDTFSSQMAHLIRELKREHRRQRYNPLLQEVYFKLEDLFGQAEFNLTSENSSLNQGISHLCLRDYFKENFWQTTRTLDKLLDFEPIEPGFIIGSLLVVPLANQKLQETYQMQFDREIQSVNDEFLQKMARIRDGRSYPESLRSAMKSGAIELVKLLQEGVEKTQYLEQESQQLDRYYAFPLFTFVSSQEMEQYWQTKPEEPEDKLFREILSTYIRSLYPVDTVLPIGTKYDEFPFVVFRCYSLQDMRNRMFTEKYLLTSNELNVLNLILSKPIPQDE